MKIIICVILCFATYCACVESNDLEISVNLESKAYTGTPYEKLFKVINKDAAVGKAYDIRVEYVFFLNQSVIKNSTFTLAEVNQWKTTDTGSMIFDVPGIYLLEGTILNSTPTDNNSENNHIVQEIEVLSTALEGCDLEISLSLEKQVYEQGESIKINYDLDYVLGEGGYPFTVMYWIEDSFGVMYKSPANSTNTNQKSWEAEISEKDKVLYLHAEVFPSCDDRNLENNKAQEMMIILNPAESPEILQSTSIVITNAPDEAAFGDSILAEVELSRGNASKYTVSAWVEQGEDKASGITKVHLKEKYGVYAGELPIQLKPNCDSKLSSGSYDLVIEGFDVREKKQISLAGNATTLCKSTSSSSSTTQSSVKDSGITYEIKEISTPIILGQQFTADIEFVNNDAQEHTLSVWSYVYRASKSYSGERGMNNQSFVLAAGSKKTISMENTLLEAEPGSYSFKAMFLVDDQKTPKELKAEIEATAQESSDSIGQTRLEQKGVSPQEIADNTYTILDAMACLPELQPPIELYSGATRKSKALVPYLIMATLVVIIVALLWKR